jgi:hypothetical protein
MSATIRTVLFDIASEFYSVDVTEVARIDRFIGYASNRVNRVAFGNDADIATAYLTAHMLKVQANIAAGAGSGSVSKRKTGDVEEHYAIANINPLSAPYSLTEYGIEFKNLSDNIFIEPFYV